MNFQLSDLLIRIIKAILYSAFGATIVLVTGFVFYLNKQTDLQVWHHAELDEEFTVDSELTDFTEYRVLEERLFQQLDDLVYKKVPVNQHSEISRYQHGSLSDPTQKHKNWNRSFVLSAKSPTASVLLLHGMSDSPYSLRHIGQQLNKAGVEVLGLRLPGHGTAPSGLTNITWQDMAASVQLAVQHLAKKNADAPIYIMGYSNGAALAVHYALKTLEQNHLPKVQRVVILSPAIGVTSVAAFAIWQARLGRILGLQKLAWNAILPEYDPYKYNSFAVNAGNVVYELTNEIQKKISILGNNNQLNALPPILAFSSVVDATVVTSALVHGLFERLPIGGHELVLFDINHQSYIKSLMKWDPTNMIHILQADKNKHFTLTMVSNKDKQAVHLYTLIPQNDQPIHSVLGLQWPHNLYSLAHVSLPFSENDPIYGYHPDADHSVLQLGNIALRGEKGVLQISGTEMMRLRWNPFYPYIESKVFDFFNLTENVNYPIKSQK